MSGSYAVARALSVIRLAMATMEQEDGVIVMDVAAELPDEAAALDDALRRVVRHVQASEALRDAAGLQADALRLREKRFDDQARAGRAVILEAMEVLGEKKKVLPEATVTVRAGSPAVVITDETALPADYIRVKREPDKGLIGKALKDGFAVAGAELSNARPALALKSN